MGRWSGTYTELAQDTNFSECDDHLDDVVVSDERISLDWSVDQEKYNAVLRQTTVEDCERWRGAITVAYGAEHHKCGSIDGIRYDLYDGGVLLVAHWIENDYSGVALYELHPNGE